MVGLSQLTVVTGPADRAIMTKTCSKCGSTRVQTINVEMAFARGKAEPVYVLAGNSVCLDCGFAECFLPQESLAKLKQLCRA
jgi:hypothetical protein